MTNVVQMLSCGRRFGLTIRWIPATDFYANSYDKCMIQGQKGPIHYRGSQNNTYTINVLSNCTVMPNFSFVLEKVILQCFAADPGVCGVSKDQKFCR